MQKYLFKPAVFLSLFILLQSCTKESAHNSILKEVTIDATILAGTDYELSLAPFGDDDNIATIIQQARHFSVSQLENLSDVFNPVYYYVPNSKITGMDKVVLAISKNPDCKRFNRDSTIITINFTIK